MRDCAVAVQERCRLPCGAPVTSPRCMDSASNDGLLQFLSLHTNFISDACTQTLISDAHRAVLLAYTLFYASLGFSPTLCSYGERAQRIRRKNPGLLETSKPAQQTFAPHGSMSTGATTYKAMGFPTQKTSPIDWFARFQPKRLVQ
jgi:hypothetical protein